MCAYIILHNMIIDDEQDNDYDENYYTATFVVVLPLNYEAPTSLTSILQRKTHLTLEVIFLNL
jgi:hypothetical protein